MEESRPRFERGIEAVIKLWTQQDVVHQDPFYRFGPVTSSPRPVQQPHPPVFVADVGTPQSFEWAGRQGYGLMIFSYLSDYADVQRNVRLYRETLAAHHPGRRPRKVQMSFHCHVAEAEEPIDQYVRVFRESASAWQGRSSAAYPDYDAIVRGLDSMSYDRVLRETRLHRQPRHAGAADPLGARPVRGRRVEPAGAVWEHAVRAGRAEPAAVRRGDRATVPAGRRRVFSGVTRETKASPQVTGRPATPLAECAARAATAWVSRMTAVRASRRRGDRLRIVFHGAHELAEEARIIDNESPAPELAGRDVEVIAAGSQPAAAQVTRGLVAHAAGPARRGLRSHRTGLCVDAGVPAQDFRFPLDAAVVTPLSIG
jgi:hypothetical protein